jgi:hypothetical protein
VLWRPYSTGILHYVSDQMQNLPNYFTTPNKMTSENDIKGLVSLKFLRPWAKDIRKSNVHVLMRPQTTRAIMNAVLFPSEDIYYQKKAREPRLV